VGPQDPKDVTRDLARDLSGIAGELVALKGDAAHRLREQPEYAVLLLRLENAHAAVHSLLSSPLCEKSFICGIHSGSPVL
jgi:hypothetical protein